MGSFDACVLGERICYLEKEVEALRTQRDALRRSQDNCGLGVEVCDLRAELVAVRRTLEHTAQDRTSYNLCAACIHIRSLYRS